MPQSTFRQLAIHLWPSDLCVDDAGSFGSHQGRASRVHQARSHWRESSAQERWYPRGLLEDGLHPMNTELSLSLCTSSTILNPLGILQEFLREATI